MPVGDLNRYLPGGLVGPRSSHPWTHYNTLTVGYDDHGHDVKFFGATSGAYFLWDESADKIIFDKSDIHVGDTDFVMFGDAAGGDVSVNWTGSVLQISPAADDTGSINVGDGTTDIDLKVFLNGAAKYVLFDVGNTLLTLEDVDLKLGDNDILQFGDASGGDVSIRWNAANLAILPAVDDTGVILFGDGTTDMDVRFTVGAATDYIEADVGAKALEIVGDARLDFTGCTVAAANTDGGIIRGGTSGAPITEDTAGMNFMNFYFDSGATSGWNAGLYLTGLATGAGGNWTSIEGDVTVSAAVADTTGVESFMAFSSGGKVTGHAAAGQYTIDYANAALAFSGGAYMAGRFNIKGEGSSCDPSGAIRMSCLELQTQGTFATGKDFELHAAGYAMYFNGFTAASGVTNILSSTRLAELPAGTVGIRVGVGADGAAGTAYYIPLVPATEWN